MEDKQREICSDLKRKYEYEKLRGEDVLPLYQAIGDPEYQDIYEAKRTLIQTAAYYADPIAVDYLIKSGASVMVFDDYEATPMHYIASPDRRQNLKDEDIKAVTELLLAAKASTMRKNSSGKCAFHLAAERNNEPFLQAFIEAGVKMKMTDNEGQNVLHKIADEAGRHQESRKYVRDEEALKVHDEVAERFFRNAKQLTDYGLDLEVRDRNQKTPAMIAAERNAKKVAVVLMGEYDESDPNLSLRVKAGGKHLHLAVKSVDEEAVAALIGLGADVNEVYQEVPFLYQTPLAVACMIMHPGIVKLLLEAHADPNFRAGESERSALFWMVKYCYYNQEMYNEKRFEQVMDLLLAAGLDLDAPADEHDNSCIACAYTYKAGSTSSFGYGSFEDLFVRKVLALGADVNHRNKQGKTALMEFVESLFYARENVLLDLLEAGAETDIKDNLSETILMKAARNRNDSLVVQVAETLSDFGDLLEDAVNNEGKTAMDIALEHNNQELAKWIVERM